MDLNKNKYSFSFFTINKNKCNVGEFIGTKL